MIVYEKNNKLNINFDNEVNENPDLQISKENGKTSVTIDGQPGGGGSEPLVVTFSGTTDGGDASCDKTWAQILNAVTDGRAITTRYIAPFGAIYTLSTVVAEDWIGGAFLQMRDPAHPNLYGYTSILCSIGSDYFECIFNKA